MDVNGFVATILVISGSIVVLSGTLILAVSAIQAVRALGRAAGATEAPVTADGLAKVLEMLSKLPQWLLAVLTGDHPALAGHPRAVRSALVAELNHYRTHRR